MKALDLRAQMWARKNPQSFRLRVSGSVEFLTLADRTGLEPATSAVTGRHSNQLNYRSFQQLETL
jgi:hypothetical protein